MARECDPGGYRGAGQGGGFLEGQVARHVHERLLVQHGVFRQHPVEIGAKPVGEIVGLDWSAKPARMKATGNPVTNLDPRHPVADRRDLASTVGQRHDADLRRTATAPFEHHQVAIVERAGAHPHQDLSQARPRILARSQCNAANTTKAIDVIGFHSFPPVPSSFNDGWVSALLQMQLTASPPSTTNSVPVIYLASSDARNSAA